MISKEFIEPFVNPEPANIESARSRVLEYAISAFQELESKVSPSSNSKDLNFITKYLSFSFNANRPLNTYTGNDYQRTIFEEILQYNFNKCTQDELELKIAADSIYRYWKIIPVEKDYKIPLANGDGKKGKHELKNYTQHPEHYDLNIEKYKSELFNALSPILEALGVDTKVIVEKFAIPAVGIDATGTSAGTEVEESDN